jgi:hypothetical protein
MVGGVQRRVRLSVVGRQVRMIITMCYVEQNSSSLFLSRRHQSAPIGDCENKNQIVNLLIPDNKWGETRILEGKTMYFMG